MKQIAAVFLITMLSGFVVSCNDYNTPKQLEFYYYPSKNVYYNVAAKMFYFSLDGGSSWDSVIASTGKEPATLGAKQVLYSSTSNIWANNRMHLQQYNGEAINIASGDTTVTNSKPVADRKIKKAKVLPANTQTKEPEKKPGFFRRLFGKKSKD